MAFDPSTAEAFEPAQSQQESNFDPGTATEFDSSAAQSHAALTVSLHAGQNPDRAAQNRALAKQFNTLPEVVDKYPDEFRQQQLARIAHDALQDAPVLQKHILQGAAPILHDDVPNTAQIERTLTADAWVSLKGAGAKALAAILQPSSIAIRALMDTKAHPGLEDPSAFLQHQASDDYRPTRITGQITSGLGYALAGPGAPLLMAASEGAAQAQELQDQGVDRGTSLVAGGLTGTILGAVQKIPLGNLQWGQGLKTWLSSLAGASVKAGAVGAAQSVVGDEAVSELLKVRGYDELAGQYAPTAEKALESALFMGGLHLGMQGMHRLARVAAANSDLDKVHAAADLAGKSKFRERDQQAFKKYVQEITEDANAPKNVYVDGQVFAQSMEKAGVSLNHVEAVIPGLADQVREAVQTNGYVRIPTADYLTHIAGGKMDADLLPHLKTDPEAPTKAEQEALFDSYREAIKEHAKQPAEQVPEPEAPIADTIRQQLEASGAYRPEVNKVYSTLAGEFINRMSERLGISPEEAYQKYGPTILGGKVKEQAAFGHEAEQYRAPQEGPVNPAEAWQELHVAKAAEHELTPRQTEVFAPKPDRDPLTGLYSDEEMRPAIQRAAQEGGWHYAEADLSNLGGINKYKGGNSHADEVIKEIGQAWQKHFPEIAGRRKGARFAALTKENPAERLAAVKKEVAQIIEKHGLTEMPNQKAGGKGAEFYTGHAESKGGVDSTIEEAQNLIQSAQPKEVSDVNRSEIRQAWLESLGGQAGRAGARIAEAFRRLRGESGSFKSETESLARPAGERRNAGEFQQPNEHRLANHKALAEKEGLKNPEAFQPHTHRDSLTGWFTDRERIPTIERVQDYLNKHPEKDATYASADVSNLGGLNEALGHHHADEVFRSIANIFADHLHKLGGDVVLVRHGGDEFSAVVVGADRAAVEKALADARAEVAQYIHSIGLESLPHAKEPLNKDRAGVGMYTDARDIEPGTSAKETIDAADEGIELAKKTQRQEAQAVEPVQFNQTSSQHGTLGDVLKKWQELGIDGYAYEKNGVIHLSKIEVPKDERAKGIGTNAMQEIVRYADATGQRIELSPSTDFGASSKGRLVDFYKRFGFVENKGRNKDFTTQESMYREPHAFNDKSDTITRGYYKPIERLIALTKDANYSTFPHELGHWALDTYSKIAALPDAPPEIRADMDALLDHLGVKGDANQPALDKWHSMSLEQQRPYHEQFATLMEAYMFEGKAPSLKLQPVLARISAWVRSVYRSISNLGVTLDPEVRGIIDRMLASEDAIKEAEAVRGYWMPEVKPEGVSDKDWQELKDLHDTATNISIDDLQAKSLRDMKWLSGARSKALKSLQKEADAQRAAIREEVSKEVEQQPIYRAERWLTKGEMVTEGGEEIKAEKGFKLSTEGVKSLFETEPEANRIKPAELPGMTSHEGLDPDIVAEMFGFSSGESLVRALVEREPMEDAIKRLTDQRMLEQHGELATHAAIESAAEQAIHNEARARFTATMLKVLTKSPIPVRKLMAGAKEIAEATIAGKKVREISPRQYEAAEARANREMLKALPKDPAKAANEQRASMLNNQLAKSARKALEEVESIRKYISSSQKPSARKAMGADYADQRDALLEKYDFGNASLRGNAYRAEGGEVQNRADFRTWVKGRLAVGQVPYLSESLLSQSEYKRYRAAIDARDADGDLVVKDEDERLLLLAEGIDRSESKNYKDMTMGELRALHDTLRSIETVGRNQKKLLSIEGEKEYKAVRTEMAESIKENAKRSGKNTRTANDWIGQKLQSLAGFGAAHIKVATWARIMDGGKDNGAVWRYLVRPANEAATRETTMRAEVTRSLDEILRPVLSKVPLRDKAGKGKFFEHLGTSLNWEERFAMLLNYGNESNLQRLLGGGIAGKRAALNAQDVIPVLESFTREELEAAQHVWDAFERYRPEIATLERDTTGVEPEWIAAREFTVRSRDGETVTLRGGYYPVKFDPRANMKSQQHGEAENAKELMRAAYSSDTTRRSFVKNRAEEVQGRPLMLNLQGLYSGLNDVIHDLSWRKWAIDANRLMRSKTLDAAIREHYGPEVKREFEKWRTDVVVGSRALDDNMEKAAAFVRQSVSMAGLAFNVTSAAMQPLGLTNSIVRLGGGMEGTRWIGRGLAQYLSNPAAAAREANEGSAWMANRTSTRFRELNELRNQVQGQTHAKELMGRYSYYLMLRTQQIVDVITWHGAQQKALAEGHDEKTAVALADQVVKDSQGGGEEVDQAGIERTGKIGKLFTVFYSFMNTGLNMGYLSKETPGGKAKFAADMLLLYSVPAVLAAAFKNAITPGDSGDDKHLMQKLAEWQLTYLIGLFAFVREATPAVQAVTGDRGGMADYSGPAGLRMFGDLAKFGLQASQGHLDDSFRKASVNLMGDLTGLPSAQLNRTITGAEALKEGKTGNPAALVFGYQEPH